MEFTHGRRDRLYGEDDDQEEASKQPPLVPPPSSSSSPSSSSTGFRWSGGASGSGGGSCSDTPYVEKEHMFDKVVTPSDVGKLNRLVIPKQHAEKYFPLKCGSGTTGMLLNFEDASGKVWRFRYSYWNSSQSYVLTKGWSRFVKEKSLKAGDVVSFWRSSGPEKQLYIDWKPQGVSADVTVPQAGHVQVVRLFGVNIFRTPVGGGGGNGGGGEGKRGREMESLPPEQFVKKQRLGALQY